MSNARLVLRLLLSGGIHHIAILLVGLIRVPLVITYFGTETFASYAAALGFWTLIAAIGESARQRIRILEFSKSSDAYKSKILWQSVGLAFLVGIVAATIFICLGGKAAPDIGTLSVAFVCGVMYVPFAMAIGHLEGQFKFATTNLTLAVGQIVGLLISIWGCVLGQIWIVGFSVLIPFFIPGLVAYAMSFRNASTDLSITDESSNVNDQNGSRTLLLLVLFSETLVYAIDGALILMFAGPEQAAIFAVLQRIVAVFAILPIVVAPLASSLNIRQLNTSLKQLVSRIQIYTGLALFAIVMAIGLPIFSVLSQGQLQLSFWTLTCACASGLILALTTTEIQSATSSRLIRTKAATASMVALCNISITVGLSPFIGAAAAFVSTGAGQVCYFLAVKRSKRGEKKLEG